LAGGRTILGGGGGDPFWSYIFCSGHLKEALETASVTGWKFEQCIVEA
jgi:hypothetical protein